MKYSISTNREFVIEKEQDRIVWYQKQSNRHRGNIFKKIPKVVIQIELKPVIRSMYRNRYFCLNSRFIIEVIL